MALSDDFINAMFRVEATVKQDVWFFWRMYEFRLIVLCKDGDNLRFKVRPIDIYTSEHFPVMVFDKNNQEENLESYKKLRRLKRAHYSVCVTDEDVAELIDHINMLIVNEI